MLERIKFMKVNRHKRFEYSPRYYDERKERLDRIKAKYAEEGEKVKTAAAYRERLRQSIEDNWGKEGNKAIQSRSANLRLILILVLLLAGAYFLLDAVELFNGEVTNLDEL